MAQFSHKFVISQQKKGDQSYPDLRHNGVLTRPQKALDLEILLDPLEKQLDLPSLPVDVGDGPRRKMKDVGQIDVVLSGIRVPVSDSTQNPLVFRRVGAGQDDDPEVTPWAPFTPLRSRTVYWIPLFRRVTKKTFCRVRRSNQRKST